MSLKLGKVINQLELQQLKILAAIFILLHIALFALWGIGTGLEAEKYTSAAEQLITGDGLPEKKYLFYLPIILLIAISKLLHLPLVTVVLVQMALSAWAQFSFNRMIFRTAGSRVAFLGSLLLLFAIPFQQWNLFLYSDSLFLSLSLLFVTLLYRARSKLSFKTELFTLLFLILLICTRPNGILLIFPYLGSQITRISKWKWRLLFAMVCFAGLAMAIAVVNYIYRNGNDMDVLRPYIEEHIICFVPTKVDTAQIAVARTGSPVGDLSQYAIDYPANFFKMIGLRLLSFFDLSRSYYSTMNNLYLVVLMSLIYTFALPGFRKYRQIFGVASSYIGILLISHPLLIGLQCDDWHSRFTMTIFPYIAMLAAGGITIAVERLQKAKT